MIKIKSFFLFVFLIVLSFSSFCQPPCGDPPCPGGNGNGGGGKPCAMPPCVPIDNGLYFLLAVGVLYGAKKYNPLSTNK